MHNKAPGLGSLGKALCVGATSASLACASAAQVRLPPNPEPCPAGAVEAMEQLDIDGRDRGEGSFFLGFHDAQPITITEGSVRVLHMLGLGVLPQNSILSGRLIFGEERVYGRLTQARSPDGSINIPVCLEIEDTGGGRGLIPMANGTGSNTVTVFSDFRLQAVKEFK